MAENRAIEETTNGHCDLRMPHISMSNENRQVQESPSNIRYTLASISPGTAFNFGVRTAERSRIFADNISSTIRPLIQQAAVCRNHHIIDIRRAYLINYCTFN